MNESQPPLNAEKLNQLSKKELVKMLLTQQKVIEKLQLEIQKLKLSRETDSKTSSLPPSTDLLKKSEKAKYSKDTASSESKKRLHGGQPGHQGNGTYTKKQEKIGSNTDSKKLLRRKGIIPLLPRVLAIFMVLT